MNSWNYTMKDMFKILCSLFLVLLSLGARAGEAVFDKKQIQADIAFLDSIVHAVHPDPFYYTPEEKYEELKKELLASLPDSLSPEKAYELMAPLLASLKDGHSLMMTPYGPLVDYLKAGGKVFPLDIHLSDGKLFAKRDMHKNNSFDEPTEVVSINGVDSRSLLSSILNLYPVELSEDLYYKTIERDFYVLLLYAGLLKDEKVALVLKEAGKERSYETELIPYSLYAKSQPAEASLPYAFTIDEHKKEAVVRLKNFLPSNRYYSFIDSLFDAVEQEKVRKLTLDIRGNAGGSSDAVDTLVSYVYKGRYKLYSEAYLKISGATKQKYQKRDTSLYAVIKDRPLGDLLPELVEWTYSSRPHVYAGALEVLVDKGTYSGAASFANLIKELKRGVVSGTSGGANAYFGDFLIFELPHTKLQIAISTKKFIEYSAEPEKRESRD